MFENKRVEKIQNLKEMVRLRNQQIEDTVKECKKQQEELDLAQRH